MSGKLNLHKTHSANIIGHYHDHTELTMTGQHHGTACDPDFQNFDMPTSTRIYIYFLDLFGCLKLCSKKHRNIRDIKRKIDKASKKLEKDLNIKEIVIFMKAN